MHGVFPSNRLDAAPGPMTRSVSELAQVLDVLVAPDPNDSRTTHLERPASYSDALQIGALEGKRIGVVRTMGPSTHEFFRETWEGGDGNTIHIFNETLRRLEELGAVLVDNISLAQVDTNRFGGGGFAQDIDEFFAHLDGPHESYLDMCENGEFSNYAFSSIESCKNSYTWAVQHGSPASAAYIGADVVYKENRAVTERIMDRLELDALLYPADAWGIPRNTSNKSNCLVNSTSQLPSLTFPAGQENGLPIGMVLQGRMWDEATLLALAYDYEQHTGWRRNPDFPSSPSRTPTPSEVRTLNNVRTEIGRRAWDETLRDNDPWALSFSALQRIADEVLAEEGLDHLR